MKKYNSYLIAIMILAISISGCSGFLQVFEKNDSGVLLDGEALLNDRCVECHTLIRVINARYSLEAWTIVVDRMLRKDIPITPEERQTLIDYLYANYPGNEVEQSSATSHENVRGDGEELLNTRCIECHTLQRVERQRLTLEEWRTLVDSMIREGAVLSADEQEILIQYLFDRYPRE